MGWIFSQFGEQLGRGSGIGELMDDLGHALAVGGDEVCMLGGGQPAHLPELDAVWRRRCQTLLDDPERFKAVVGNYEPPLGNQSFRESVAALLKRRYGWDLSFKNVAEQTDDPVHRSVPVLHLRAVASRRRCLDRQMRFANQSWLGFLH